MSAPEPEAIPDKRSGAIRAMFGSIAPRYDLLNHLLSLNIDRYWRRVTLRRVKELRTESGPLLDLCTGTADLALLLSRLDRVVACDFCRPMLQVASAKIEVRRQCNNIALTEADATALPFATASFSAVTVAFGLRNVESLENALREIHRVLRKDGLVAILEFSKPYLPGFAALFGWYFNHVVPRLGRLISRNDGAYRYLPASVETFSDADALRSKMEAVGFGRVRFTYLTAGVVALHTGIK